MKVLVTGAASSIGFYVACLLLVEVRICPRTIKLMRLKKRERIENQRLLFWLLLGAILVLLLLPLPSGSGDKLTYVDKLIHVLIFSGLSIVALRVWTSHHVEMALLLIAFGGLTELIQGLTGWRSASWGDFTADVLGVFLGWLFLNVVRRKSSN